MPQHLTTADLAARWGIHPKSLANSRGNPNVAHPGYFKTPGGRVLYPVAEVEAFETTHFVPARSAA